MLPDLHAAYAVSSRQTRRAILHLSARRAFLGLLVIGALQAGIGYAQVLGGLTLPSFSLGTFWDPEQRAFGTLGHPAIFAAFLISVLLLCAYVSARGQLHAEQSRWLTAYALVVMPVLVFTYERTIVFVFVFLFIGVVGYANRARA